jgi:hypothetical protein
MTVASEPNRVSDGSLTLEGGVNGSRPPSLINQNQLATAVNTTTRGGFATCRPGFRKRELDFSGDADIESLFATSHCQGAAIYEPVSGLPPFALLHVAGRLFRVAMDTYIVSELTPSTSDRGNSLLPYVWFKQGEQFMFAQDGQTRPWIFNGTIARRAEVSATPDYEMPVGTVMEYAFGRMFLANGREWVAGDIVNGGTEIYQFTENAVVNEGGAYTVPLPGNITAIRAIASLDNGVGQGPLTIHTSRGIVTARVDEPRTTWKDIKFQQIALLEHGSMSQGSASLVNSDVWFRAVDGQRSLVLARRDFGTWGNTPNSTELRDVFKFDDTSLLQYGSSILFDNRLITTVSPCRAGNGFFHRGMAVMDFDPLSSLQGKLPPVWEGVWTGFNPVHLFSGDFGLTERAFAVARNDDGGIELWEITKGDDFDNEDQPIEWTPTYRSFSFQTPRQLKRLEAAELFVDHVRGNVSMEMQFRPDQYPCWTSWHDWEFCEKYRNCAAGCEPDSYRPGYRPRMMIGQPPDSCDAGGTKSLRAGYEFQPRLAITGKCALRGLILHATLMPQPTFEPCV